MVDLSADGGVRAEVAVDQPVTFTAKIAVPPGAGEVVVAEWNFLGSAEYTPAHFSPGETVTLRATFSYSEPGTYFPVIRATSHRAGNPDDPHGRIQNLGRVRVVVSDQGT